MPIPTAIRRVLQATAVAVTVVGLPIALVDAAPAGGKAQVAQDRSTLPSQVRYKSATIDGVEVAYREAGRETRARDHPAARVPDVVAHVPQSDPGARQPVPRHRA